MNNYIGIVENNNMIKGYAWFSFLAKLKITLYGEKSPNIKNFLKKNIVFEKDNIGTYYGKWYEIQRHMVCNSNYLDSLKIESNLFLKFQSKIFQSPKTFNFYMQYLSDVEYKLLRDKVLANKLGGSFCFLLPRLHSYRILAKCYLKENEYKFSWILTFLFILYGTRRCAGSIIKMLLVKPVFVEKQKGLVLKKLAWGFGGKGLKDDLLVDDININKKDMIYYYESSTVKKNEKPLADYARKNDYKVIGIDKSFNVNECYYKSIRNNFFFAIILLIFSLIHSPFLLFGMKKFNSKAFQVFKLFSFVDVKYFWSIGNWHDIIETVVANNQQVRAFMYSWSDYAQSYLYPFNYTVQDDVFMWGPIEEKYTIHKSLHDNMFAIGCLFSNSYIEDNKEIIFNDLGLSSIKKTIVFYDSPVSNEMRFPQSLFDEFRNIILLVEQKYPNIQVILKPKRVTEEYKDFFSKTTVKLCDSRDVYLGDIINISTLNVGMGIVAPVTVSLIMNIPGIFYDTAGNYDTPFAKYEGDIVFRERNSLLKKIDQVLEGNVNSINIKEINDYNATYNNPIEILKKYLITGVVDEKYRLY